MEWLTLTHRLTSRRTVVLQLSEKNWASLYVRSTHAWDRGRILLRLEGMRLVDRPEPIVAAYEKTLLDASWSEPSLLRTRIEPHWIPLQFRIVDV